MRKTLATVIASCLVFGIGSAAGAQKCGQPMEVAANTPPAAIAKLVVDQMFSDIVLNDTQQSKAVAIVVAANTDAGKLDRKAADYRKKLDAVMAKRNADLLKLLPKDSDKAKLNACFKKMERPASGGGGGGALGLS